MKIAILAAHDPTTGQYGFAQRVLSGIGPDALPGGTVILEYGGTLLKTLEAAAGFDGMILIDGASMGMSPGGVRVFGLNDLILPGSPPRVKFDSVDVEGDILYANKFLSLPPVRIIGIESGEAGAGETGAGIAGPLLDAIRQAVCELTQK